MAVGGGVPDVEGIMTPDVITSIIGSPVGDPTYYASDEWVGWEWQSTDGSHRYAAVRAAFYVAGGVPHEPNDFWDGYMRPKFGATGSAVDLPDIGQDAFQSGTQVYARIGDHIFYTMGDFAAETMRSLARLLD